MPLGQSTLLDNIGSTSVIGEGTAGTPIGGVLTIQGPNTGGALASSFLDTNPATQSITTLDSGTSSLVGANGQVFYFGTPTANSAASFVLSSIGTVTLQATLLGSGGTMVVETSMDGGSFWMRPNVYQPSTQFYSNGFTLPFSAVVNTAGLTNIRVRSTVSWTGSATILIHETVNSRPMTIADALPTGGNTIGGILPLTNSSVIKSQLQDNAGTAITLGQKVMASSVPMTIASDQSAIPASQSGAWTISTKTDLAPAAPATNTVGVTSATAVASNASRKGLVIVNVSVNKVSFGMAGNAAVLNSGITLYPGGTWVMDEYTFNKGAVTAIASAASSVISIQELL